MERLSGRLRECGVPRSDGRELRRYRLFYLTYPQIRDSLPPEFAQTLSDTRAQGNIREAPTPKSLILEAQMAQELGPEVAGNQEGGR